MRSISFNESTVLTEYARIIQEKSLVKTAATAAPTSATTPTTPPADSALTKPIALPPEAQNAK